MTHRARDEATGLCAAGEAAWQALAHRSLGARWDRGDGFDWAPGGAAHPLLHALVTLEPHPRLPPELPAGRVCDSFAALDRSDLPPGHWVSEPAGPWMVRDPAPAPDVRPIDGVDLVEVVTDADTTLFERTAFLAAGGAPPDRPGELHPAGSQNAEELHLLLATIEGRGVGTGFALGVHDAVLVSAVAVVPAVRGRGIGTAITARCLELGGERVATLTASERAVPLYRRLGFVPVGRAVHWAAAPDGRSGTLLDR